MAIDNSFLVQQIQGKEALYAAFCVNTKMPFITCDQETYNDQVWVFDTEEVLKPFIEKYAKKKYIIRGARLEQKQFLAFFASLYTIDVNEIVFVEEGSTNKISLDSLVKRPDFEKVPLHRRPVENPSLQLSGLYFMQEFTRQVPKEEKENLSALDEEFSVNIARSCYLIAVLPLEGPESLGEKIRTKKYALPLLTLKNESKYIPIFSDRLEYEKFRRGKKFVTLTVPFAGLPQYMSKEANGFILNPMGYSMLITKKLYEAVAKNFQEQLKEGVEKVNAVAKSAAEEAARAQAKRSAAHPQNGQTAGSPAAGRPVSNHNIPGRSKIISKPDNSAVMKDRDPVPAPVYRPKKAAPSGESKVTAMPRRNPEQAETDPTEGKKPGDTSDSRKPNQ